MEGRLVLVLEALPLSGAAVAQVSSALSELALGPTPAPGAAGDRLAEVWLQ